MIWALTFQPAFGWKDGRFGEEGLVQLDKAVLQRAGIYRKAAWKERCNKPVHMHEPFRT
jgi:hypothetical protein